MRFEFAAFEVVCSRRSFNEHSVKFETGVTLKVYEANLFCGKSSALQVKGMVL